MEETREIMANDEVYEPEIEEETELEKEGSAWPVLAGIGGGGVLAGAALHKYVLTPVGAKFRAWRQSRKAKKDSKGNDIIDVEAVDSEEESE